MADSECKMRCAICPERSAIGRKLAALGLVPSTPDCIGPNVVDHLELDIQEHPVPGTNLLGRSTIARLVEREELCHSSYPEYRDGETVTKVIINPLGRHWYRSIAASPSDAGLYFACGSLDDDPEDPNIYYIEHSQPDGEQT